MEQTIRRLEQVAMVIAVCCVVTIMFVVSFDAIFRYSINSPIPWAADLVTYYMMVLLVYFSLSPTYRAGDHMNINLIMTMLPRRVQSLVDLTCSLLAVTAFSIVSYGAFLHAADAFKGNEFLPGYILWPAWLSHAGVAIGAGLLVVRLVHHAYMLAKLGRDPFVDLEGESTE
jgi:TRAP-type C4-dicarboxylate transport system permease small subunit